MRVLVACEFSGIVRDAFRERGHDAWSCDLLPTERPGTHVQGDVLPLLSEPWDLLIAHPPCTYLTSAGNCWFDEERYGEKARERRALREEGLAFFRRFTEASIPRICVENPSGYVNRHYRKPEQCVQPYFFGDPHVKLTCLWLAGLPPLVYSDADRKNRPAPERISIRRPGKNYAGGEIKRHYFNGTFKSAHERSRSFPGIARAMAEQWG